MKKEKGRERVIFKCREKTYQSTVQARKGNEFFTYTDCNGRNNSKLSLAEILEVVWYWVHRCGRKATHDFCGRSLSTTSDWFNLCREIPCLLFEKREKISGVGKIVQIDECLFRGERKNHKG